MTKLLFKYQEEAVERLRTGSILFGGVGSGKSRTAIAYYSKSEKPKDLYIITTAKKRDSLEWEFECATFMLSKDRSSSIDNVLVSIDSWNNIKKYVDVTGSFFIFDEQRVVGSGVWVKSFLKISKNNNWIILTGTPGDTWMDYIPIFIANGYYRSRAEFIRRHVVYNSFTKFPKIDHYVEETRLKRIRDYLTVTMDYTPKVTFIYKNLLADFDKDLIRIVMEKRWNPIKNSPIKNISEYFYLLRRITNSHPSRLSIIKDLIIKHRKLIIFYTFNYELEILRTLGEDKTFSIAEYNGHKHQPIPDSEKWIYLVQYKSGSESWNCIETNVIVFYSLSYSYKMTVQARGRIDRLNTPFSNLYYYNIISSSVIDRLIENSLRIKKNFNERKSTIGKSFLKGD